MQINDAGQKVDGGIPQTKLTPSDLITYYGAIVGSNSDGDLATWDGESDTINFFNQNADKSYDLASPIVEDLAGRDLAYVMELTSELFG
jgi:hypothetical protein